jgi:hypothetical protein
MTFPHRAQHGAEVRERREQDREADRQDEEKRARQRPAAQASPSRSRISGRSVTLESTACPTFGEYEIGIARVIIAIFSIRYVEMITRISLDKELRRAIVRFKLSDFGWPVASACIRCNVVGGFPAG